MHETETAVIDGVSSSDGELIERARAGDQAAFAELWHRHYHAGERVARQFTSSLDADDLVSEAFTRIYQRVLAGGGPSGAFRPYLFTTIRNLASTWGARSHDMQVDDIQDFEDPATIEDPIAMALDRTLTARAFRSLPDNWQSVLWYTEIEGMDPHEVAPILGMTANGVAALSYRAREGLRKAWLQAHISEPGLTESCQWTIAHLGGHSRNGLTPRDQERIREHLLTCTKCSIVSEEVDEVGSHLAMVLLPIALGGVAGGAFLALLGHAGGASAASIPAVPASFATLAAPVVFAPTAFAPVVAAGLSAAPSTAISALVGSMAVAAVIGGTFALGISPSPRLPQPTQQVVAAAPPWITPQSAVVRQVGPPAIVDHGLENLGGIATDPARGLDAPAIGVVAGSTGSVVVAKGTETSAGVAQLLRAVTAVVPSPILVTTPVPTPLGSPVH